MKSLFNGKLAAVSGQSTNRPGSTALATRLSELKRNMREACMQVFGMPDYERYAEHMASRHPSDPMMSRGEFFNWAIDQKYCRKGPRCC